MKNQYFGDRNDFFKYDLVLTLMERLEGLERFTFVPMLTGDDKSRDGSLTYYDGKRRKDLEDFLKGCVEGSARDIRKLRSFMSNYGQIKYCPYRDGKHFTDAERERYFDGIDPSTLQRAVILIDPDNGLEIGSMRSGTGHKYLRYEELGLLYGRMGPNSLILVYQHLPPVERTAYLARIGQKVRGRTGAKEVLCLSDNRIAFFLVAKGDGLLERAWEVLEEYAGNNRYRPFRYGGNPQPNVCM
ncbi:MAG: hypothetical protein AABX40_08005 [Candidatus Hydrothermarchaeota archaeon]